MDGNNDFNPRNWINLWLWITLGTLVGYFIFPVIRTIFSQDGGWGESFSNGARSVLENGIPVALMYTAIAAIVLLVLHFKKKSN